ncbi:hypothetical protein QW131_14585 [Roseibium salinum]|nr:hypothetical protein [Roseibium salinum]
MTSREKLAMSANSDPSECASVCEEIRQVMKRPDLSDDVLLHALSGHYDQDNSLTPGALAAGQGLPEERASVIRTMIVPPPRHGLEMPAHDLAPPLSVRFAPRHCALAEGPGGGKTPAETGTGGNKEPLTCSTQPVTPPGQRISGVWPWGRSQCA